MRWLTLPPRDVTSMVFLLTFISLRRALTERCHSSLGLAARAGAAAAVAGGALAYSVDRGAFLTVTHLTFLLLLLLSSRLRGKPAAALLGGSLLGFFAATLLLGLAFRGQYGPFVRFAFETLLRDKELIDGYVFDPLGLPYLTASLLLAATTYWLALRLVRERLVSAGGRACFVDRWGLEIGLVLMSLGFFRGMLARADVAHVETNLWPAVLLFLLLLSRSSLLGLIPDRLRRLAVVGLCGVGFAIAAAGAWRAYDRNLLARNFPLRVPDETLLPPGYREAVAFLRGHLRPQESFYSLTNEGVWYYWLDRPAPTRFYIPYLAASVRAQRELVADLDRSQVTYLLYANHNPTYRLDGMTTLERLPLVAEYIHRHYRFFARIRDQEIWMRARPSQLNVRRRRGV